MKKEYTPHKNHTGNGIILVFDLDETIIDSDAALHHMDTSITHFFNPKIVDILRRSLCYRGKGVDAILLLTNNSSEEYVRNCDIAMSKLLNYKSPYWNPESFSFFDNYMIRYDRRRTIDGNNDSWISKKLYDVRIMLDDPIKIKNTSYADIARRTYFFDDIADHRIVRELAYYGFKDHHIHIKPAFSISTIDVTDYSSVHRALDRLDKGQSPLNASPKKNQRVTSYAYSHPVSHSNMFRNTNRSHRHIKGDSRNTKLNPILEEKPAHYIHKAPKYCSTRRRKRTLF